MDLSSRWGLTSLIGQPGQRSRIAIGFGFAALLANFFLHLWRLSSWPQDGAVVGRWVVAVLAVATFALVVSIGLGLRQRAVAQAAEASAAAASSRNDALSDELTRQREREDLAREVHDTLASRLTAISLQAGTLEDQTKGVAPDLSNTARTVRHSTSEALSDLRSLLSSLREGGAAVGGPSQTAGADLTDLVNLVEDAAANGLQVRPVIALDGYQSAPDALKRAVFALRRRLSSMPCDTAPTSRWRCRWWGLLAAASD